MHQNLTFFFWIHRVLVDITAEGCEQNDSSSVVKRKIVNVIKLKKKNSFLNKFVPACQEWLEARVTER